MKFKNIPLYAIYALGRMIRGSVAQDRKYLSLLYRYHFKKKCNFDDPRSYNEKLQWLKLYDRNPEYTKMVDKYEVKKYVAEKIGEEYIIPTIGVWDSFDEIDFDSLPEQFVLKCTHDSGGLVICKDKSKLDLASAKKKINHCLKRNYYWNLREWPYKNVKRRIIAEQYMEDTTTSELRDYKFFCFDGKVKAIFIVTDREKGHNGMRLDFFDEKYLHLPFTRVYKNADTPPEKPINFEKMKELAETLSTGIPHVRVDFYEVNGKVYFGELTFYPGSGMEAFSPEEWDYKFGEWVTLPSK